MSCSYEEVSSRTYHSAQAQLPWFAYLPSSTVFLIIPGYDDVVTYVPLKKYYDTVLVHPMYLSVRATSSSGTPLLFQHPCDLV